MNLLEWPNMIINDQVWPTMTKFAPELPVLNMINNGQVWSFMAMFAPELPEQLCRNVSSLKLRGTFCQRLSNMP